MSAGLRFAGGYAAWRERKLAQRVHSAAELIVDIRDPRRLTAAERRAIAERVQRSNLAVYSSRTGAIEDKEIPLALGRQLGLQRLDPNWLADDDGISSIRVREGAPRGEMIPYTSQRIRWHTDGYYNPPAQRIRAFILHCVRPAAEGGESALLDHELAYLALRDREPAWARALAREDAMTIPARMQDGRRVRAARPGPVFSLDGRSNALHMRYTARDVSIAWSSDPEVQAAAAFLAQWLDGEPPFALRLALEAGMGVVCNNVLHARNAFRDDPAAPRLLYRARYLDRIQE